MRCTGPLTNSKRRLAELSQLTPAPAEPLATRFARKPCHASRRWGRSSRRHGNHRQRSSVFIDGPLQSSQTTWERSHRNESVEFDARRQPNHGRRSPLPVPPVDGGECPVCRRQPLHSASGRRWNHSPREWRYGSPRSSRRPVDQRVGKSVGALDALQGPHGSRPATAANICILRDVPDPMGIQKILNSAP